MATLFPWLESLATNSTNFREIRQKQKRFRVLRVPFSVAFLARESGISGEYNYFNRCFPPYLKI
jgi:hypothetical protein